MVDGGPVLAVVPARGGSKSIPRKNIKDFAGHPLLAWSIAAGKAASSVDRLVVSTDDEQTAQLARDYGAEVPFLRPASLAKDDTRDLPVFEHLLKWFASEQGYKPELVVQLRPTSPIRPVDLVDRSVERLRSTPAAHSLRGVVPSGQNPFKMWTLDGQRLNPLLTEPAEAHNMLRQELPQTFWQTGHIDVIRSSTILEMGSMSGEFILAISIDPEYSIDLDTPADWVLAESRLDGLRSTIVWPAGKGAGLPEQVDLVVLDFDGVLTDNRVWVDRQGLESVAAYRGDGWGLARLRENGVEVIVLSTESDPVVKARCDKLGIESVQGVDQKGKALADLMAKRQLDGSTVVFMGNDANDLPCVDLVAYSLAPCDAHPSFRDRANRVTALPGGWGAVRELCDMILAKLEVSS